MNQKNSVTVDAVSFHKHPKHPNYFFSKDGRVLNRKTNKILGGSLTGHTDRKYRQVGLNDQIRMLVHHGVWTCFNGDIPEGLEIDHINDNSLDNRLENLQCITPSENRKKRQFDYTKITGGNAHLKRRNIKSMEYKAGEENPCRVLYFKSKKQAGQFHGVSPSAVYQICEKKNNYKSSKLANGGFIKFEYAGEDIPCEKLTIIPDKRIGTKYKKKNKSDE